MKRIILTATTALMAAVLFTACGSDKNYKALVANEWELEKIIYADSNYSEDAPSNIFLVFADSSKTMFGHLGCNTVRGAYTIADKDQIKFDKLASTMMWCDKMDFESRYSKLLEMVSNYKASTHELILSDSEGKITLRYMAKVAPAEEAVDKIEDKLENAVENADSIMGEEDTMINAIEKTKDTIEGVATDAKEAADKAVDATKEAAGKAVDATKEAAGKAVDATKEAAGKVEKAVK